MESAPTRPVDDGRVGWREQLMRWVPVVIGAILFGTVAGSSGSLKDILALVIVFVPVMLWRAPEWGPIAIMSIAIIGEQVGKISSNSLPGQPTLSMNIPFTGNLPIYRGLGSLHLEPADLLVIFMLIVYIRRSHIWGPRRWWPKSHVSAAMFALLFAVILGFLVGKSHGAQMREEFQEMRPFFYLIGAYFVTAVLIRSRRMVWMLLWAFVLTELFKTLQGLYIWYETRHWNPKPDTILGHEEAYFFSLYLLLVLGMWLLPVKCRLRKVMTWSLPLVIFVDLANHRRTAYEILGIGLIAMLLITWSVRPERRQLIKRFLICTVLALAVYLPAYWNDTGTVGGPADAVRSIFSPDPRDASSDLYRVEENANLEYNIAHYGKILGEGFGVKIDYALPIVNISKGAPYILYIPHNGVLYVLMRMGIIGGIAIWSLIGLCVIAGCRLARSLEPGFALVGMLGASAILGWAIQGALDQGFYFSRIALVTGCIIGLMEASRRLLAADSPEPAAVAPRPQPIARVAVNRTRVPAGAV